MTAKWHNPICLTLQTENLALKQFKLWSQIKKKELDKMSVSKTQVIWHFGSLC